MLWAGLIGGLAELRQVIQSIAQMMPNPHRPSLKPKHKLLPTGLCSLRPGDAQLGGTQFCGPIFLPTMEQHMTPLRGWALVGPSSQGPRPWLAAIAPSGRWSNGWKFLGPCPWLAAIAHSGLILTLGRLFNCNLSQNSSTTSGLTLTLGRPTPEMTDLLQHSTALFPLAYAHPSGGVLARHDAPSTLGNGFDDAGQVGQVQ